MKKLRSTSIRVFADDLLRHTSILFSGMMVVHVCNMAFQMAVKRGLSEEEYTWLIAFLGVLTMIQRPLDTLAVGMSHYSSLMRQGGRIGDVKRLLRKWLLLTGGAGVVFGILVAIFNGALSDFFHIPRAEPIVIAGAALPVLFCSPVLMGVSQGLQLFKIGLLAGTAGALVRFSVGAGLVAFWIPACGWAILGHGLGAYVMAASLLAGLIFILREQSKSDAPLPSMRLYLVKSFLVQAAVGVLMTADVVLVQHYLPGNMDFAFAATLGRMVVFLSGVISIAMFPKVASRGAGSPEQYRLFLKSLWLTALLSVVAVVGCMVFPSVLARIFSGETASVYLKQMIRAMAGVMGLFSLLNVVIQFLLAQQRFIPAYTVIGFTLLYLGAVGVFHSSVWQIVLIEGICILLALGTTLIWLFMGVGEKKEHVV